MVKNIYGTSIITNYVVKRKNNTKRILEVYFPESITSSLIDNQINHAGKMSLIVMQSSKINIRFGNNNLCLQTLNL